MPDYQLLPKAEQDLENIWRYTQQRWGVEQAFSYINKLIDIFELLAESPLMCRERREFTPPVRFHFHASHLAVYSEFMGSESIQIIRVLHKDMDVESHLKSDI